MKTLLQQMQDVDKSDENSACVSSEDMFSQFALQDYSISYDKFDSRFKKYWLEYWLCTDSYAGNGAIYLDGELIALSSKRGRKWDDVFYFVSNEAACKARDACIDCMVADKTQVKILSDNDINSTELQFKGFIDNRY